MSEFDNLPILDLDAGRDNEETSEQTPELLTIRLFKRSLPPIGKCLDDRPTASLAQQQSALAGLCLVLG